MEVFAIAPSVGRTPWFLLLPIVGLVIATIALAMVFFGPRTARFEVSPAGLRLRGDLYGRFIPIADLVAAEARRVDFAASPDMQPGRRTLGTGFPGYQAGWFRLRSGEKALVFLTDRSRAVYVPTRAGYGLLLSPLEPDDFVSSLRAMPGQR